MALQKKKDELQQKKQEQENNFKNDKQAKINLLMDLKNKLMAMKINNIDSETLTAPERNSYCADENKLNGKKSNLQQEISNLNSNIINISNPIAWNNQVTAFNDKITKLNTDSQALMAQ